MDSVSGIGIRSRILHAGLSAVAPLAFAFGVLGCVQANAQTAEQTAEVVKSLSTQSHAVVARLSDLNHLSADEWRFHPGDLPHGESPDLDDSNWKPVTAKAEAPQDAVWYRHTIEVPQTLHGYDLTGARIWFSFAAYANGPMPEIIYFNGGAWH